MLRCEEVSRLCASDELLSASLLTRASVRMHLLMCRHCRRYFREIARIGSAVRDLYRDRDEPERDEALVRRIVSGLPGPPE